jgi:dihydroxyacetone kinase-like protein
MANEVKLKDVLAAIANAVIAAESELTELDSALGDGDCGQGMKSGFTAVLETLKDSDDDSSSDILKKAAMALISVVGGTSGAIYGTAFMKMAAAAKESPSDLVGVAAVLEAGLNGAKMRGENTQIGDKTLVDALEPAVYAFKEKAETGVGLSEALDSAADAAKKGSDRTIDLMAKKGRASYLGERSIGHRDAGSYGIVVIAKAAADAVKS